MMATAESAERQAMRERPTGNAILYQNWENLLFLHWAIEPDLVRAKVPASLELDLFDDKAWIGVTPFAMTGVHLKGIPQIPGFDSFLELNVRTYVIHDGKPGVFFFSLDASKAMPAVAARVYYSLPYFKARMEFFAGDGKFRFHSRRLNSNAEFSARWKPGKLLGEAAPDSLEFFLVERYALFTTGSENADKVLSARVYHRPWILEEAIVESHHSTMISVLGIPEPTEPPLAHFSRFQGVETWEPQKV